MTKLVVWPAVIVASVVATWLINGLLFPSTVVPARQVAWTAVVLAVIALAVAWTQRQRA